MEENKKIPFNIRLLGWVSFFTDVSSEMILPILPLFLRNVLKASMTSIGFIEGLADATASLLKVVSGYWSDRIHKRKALVVAGYSLSTLVKPVLAVVTQWWHVLIIRFTDRVGKGVRTAPRDALIADSTDKKHRGRSFGFHRAMDTAGAVVGTLLAFLILSLGTSNYRVVFLLSIIPGAIAVSLLLMLKEKASSKSKGETITLSVFGKMGKRYYLLLLLMVFGTFANVSYAFFILRASDLGVSDHFIPLIYLVYNVAYASLAMPVGIWSDRRGRVPILILGYLVMAFVMLGFAHATIALHAWLLFVAYGLVSAILETIPRAFVTDLVAQEVRGSGLGLYHTTVGIAALPGSVIFGYIWNNFSAQIAFYYGSVMSVLAIVCLLLVMVIRNERRGNER